MTPAVESAVAERYLSSFLAQATDPILGLDAAQRVLYCNASAAAMLGIAPDAAAGLDARTLPIWTPELDAALAQIGTPGDLVPASAASVSMQVQARSFDVTLSSVFDPGGATTGTLLVWRDVTEAHRLLQQLTDADRRKDEFLSMLAHELRNPLAPISAAAEILRMAKLDEARVRKTSEVIARQVRHMTSLVDDLMDVSRVTRGLVHIEHTPVNVREVMADAVEQSQPLVRERRHALSVNYPVETLFIKGDRKRLVQVIANLLNNAAKYTPPGGCLELSGRVEGSNVVVVVSDNGIGMTAELVQQAFDLFTQAERTADRSQGGLGIGLALVRSLVELHHGTVSAHSAGPGSGSEFRIVLPRLRIDLPAQSAPPVEEFSAPRRRRKVMVVDDNLDAARMLAEIIDAAGHDVRVESDPRRALETAATEDIDTFVLDIGLPQLDGYELAAALRRLPHISHALIIAVTGYGLDSDRARSREAGFDYHFVKPVDSSRLVSLLD